MTAACTICSCIDSSPREDLTRCRHCHQPASLFAAIGRTAVGAIELAQPVESRRFPDIRWADCRAEIDRELAYRNRAYPDRVVGGRMTQADAEYQRAIFAAIGADVDRMAHVGPDAKPTVHRYSWNERRQALSREIDMRERFYPEWVENGRLTQPVADRQLACIRAILWRYDCGFDWRPSNRTLDITAQQMLDGVKRNPAQDDTWAEMDAIWRHPGGYFYRRWPDLDAPIAAEAELALTV